MTDEISDEISEDISEEISDEDLFEDIFENRFEDSIEDGIKDGVEDDIEDSIKNTVESKSRTKEECYNERKCYNETYRKHLQEDPCSGISGIIDALTNLYEARDEVEFRRTFRRLLLRLVATVLCGVCLSFMNLLFLR